MKNLIRNVGAVLITFMLISGIFVLYSAPKEKPEDVSLSTLVSQINEGKVTEISVTNDQLAIELKEGKKEKAIKERESGLTESLKNYGVDPEKLKLVNIKVKEDSSASFWLSSVLPFLLPFLLCPRILYRKPGCHNSCT